MNEEIELKIKKILEDAADQVRAIVEERGLSHHFVAALTYSEGEESETMLVTEGNRRLANQFCVNFIDWHKTINGFYVLFHSEKLANSVHDFLKEAQKDGIKTLSEFIEDAFEEEFLNKRKTNDGNTDHTEMF